MGSHVRARLTNLMQGFWFVPGLITIALGALSLFMISLDRAAGPRGVPGAFDGDATAARSILSTISGSLITVAGLAFTLTVVTLQLVSSQFTPRALRNFLGDRINQVTAGSFVGIFLYCLLVLRSVRTSVEDKDGFIPALSVTIGIVLAVFALGMLLAFIHHVASSIQVSNIAARIARQSLGRVDGLFPEAFGRGLKDDAEELASDWSTQSPEVEVYASRPGYIQIVDVGELVEELGTDGELRVLVEVCPGDFVTPYTRLVSAWGTRCSDPDRAVHSAIRIDSERDITQDVGYGIRQLADIALRALSPGINDPTTALDCIGYLRAIIERLAARDLPAKVRATEDESAVVVVRRREFSEYVADAFVEVGRFATADARVAVALIEACGSVARVSAECGAYDRAAHLQAVARDVAETTIGSAKTESDRLLVGHHLERALASSSGAS